MEQYLASQVIADTCQKGLIEEEVTQLPTSESFVFHLFQHGRQFNIFVSNIWA
tara:strand:- start:13 stop:171 length:159 start_codon:yes stop_codon:yes gene_type:complete